MKFSFEFFVFRIHDGEIDRFYTSFVFFNKDLIYGTEECTMNLSENLGADGSFVSIR
jgi:hypothetical protein